MPAKAGIQESLVQALILKNKSKRLDARLRGHDKAVAAFYFSVGIRKSAPGVIRLGHREVTVVILV